MWPSPRPLTENKKLKEKNKTLSASLDKAKEGSVLKRLEDAKLRQDYEAALKTLDSIPPEVIRFYENRTQEPVMRHDNVRSNAYVIMKCDEELICEIL